MLSDSSSLHFHFFRWPDAGFFHALHCQFGPFVQYYYELAGRLRDLKLGDLHFIPISSRMGGGGTTAVSSFSPRSLDKNNTEKAKFLPETETKDSINDSAGWIALLVGQKRHDKRISRDGSPVLDISAIKQGLLKLRNVSVERTGCKNMNAFDVGSDNAT